MTAILVLKIEGHANKRTALPYDSLVGASSHRAPVRQDAARIATWTKNGKFELYKTFSSDFHSNNNKKNPWIIVQNFGAQQKLERVPSGLRNIQSTLSNLSGIRKQHISLTGMINLNLLAFSSLTSFRLLQLQELRIFSHLFLKGFLPPPTRASISAAVFWVSIFLPQTSTLFRARLPQNAMATCMFSCPQFFCLSTLAPNPAHAADKEELHVPPSNLTLFSSSSRHTAAIHLDPQLQSFNSSFSSGMEPF